MRMRITVRTGQGLSSALSDLARRRIEFALGRFDHRVRSVTIRLGDINGPRGGIDKTCRVVIRLDAPKPTIVVEDTDANPAAAIGRTADRAAQAVASALDKSTGRRSLRPRFPGGIGTAEIS